MINFFQNKVLLNVKGKNINRFIKKLTTRKIEILSLKYISKNEIEMLIYKKNYETVLKIKSIYDVLEKDIFGPLKIKKVLKINKHLIIIFILCYLFFIFLTHLILDIEIIHSNKEIRNLVKEELNKNGIKKYTLKKDYQTIQKIKENILNKQKNKLEWLEIENKGTKYIVRIEEREILANKENNKPRSIIAKKDAVIKKVIAKKGSIIRNTDDYVKKDDIIISGEVSLNDKIMGKVKAEGQVYGEVWYVIKTKYPFVYKEEKETGRKKEIYTLKFLNHSIEFTLNKFQNKKIKEKEIFSNQLIPLKLVKQNQKEIKEKKWILTFDEALIKAKEMEIKKVKQNLKENEYIIKNKYLKSSVNNSTIEVEMFFAVYENITKYIEIE